jgi:hypothetical protein
MLQQVPGLGVIFMSGYLGNEPAAEFPGPMVVKPIHNLELLRTIRHTLRSIAAA